MSAKSKVKTKYERLENVRYANANYRHGNHFDRCGKVAISSQPYPEWRRKALTTTILMSLMLLLSGCNLQLGLLNLPEPVSTPQAAKAIKEADKNCKECQRKALTEFDKSVKLRNADEKNMDKIERNRIKHQCDGEIVTLPGQTEIPVIPEPIGEILPDSGTFKSVQHECKDGKCK